MHHNLFALNWEIISHRTTMKAKKKSDGKCNQTHYKRKYLIEDIG